MPGRIRDEDIAKVREASAIEDVVGEHVQLRNAGGGNLKGLCPFHDEKSPSFSVSPGKGLFYCFGCGAGGDVIRFIEQVEHLGFSEAAEQLAARANIQLTYTDGPSGSRAPGQRARLVEAHKQAAAFYTEQLRTPEAQPARDFLRERGFDEDAAAHYGCGYSSSAWDGLTKHLLNKGFSPDELTVGGLSKQSERGGLVDRFRKRLLWPIRDVNGDVVGFGGRRLTDDDKSGPKYLNTPETPIYKKGHLLYGIDLAKREIARQHRAVIVEGYTDVMACHLAGVTTAVATCGTAFGSDHVGVLRRMLMDSDAFRGEVIFTFDGDAAGMKAAERAFGEDQKFMSQTYVAVESSGKDPCELRQSSGDAAVRDLVARRVPLVEFVLRNTVGRFDLDTAEGRSGALDKAVPMVAQIKDRSLQDEYARRLAGLVGVDDPLRVVARVRGLVRSGRPTEAATERPAAPRVDDAVASVEREVLKLALQQPALAGPQFDALPHDGFLLPAHRLIVEAIAEAGGSASGVSGPAWPEKVGSFLPEQGRSAVVSMAVEPMHTSMPLDRYAAAILPRLEGFVVDRQIAALKGRLQRTNPLEQQDDYNRMFGELIGLERQRQLLREQALGPA